MDSNNNYYCAYQRKTWDVGLMQNLDRKSVVQGKSVDLGGRRIIKKKKKQTKVARNEITETHN